LLRLAQPRQVQSTLRRVVEQEVLHALGQASRPRQGAREVALAPVAGARVRVVVALVRVVVARVRAAEALAPVVAARARVAGALAQVVAALVRAAGVSAQVRGPAQALERGQDWARVWVLAWAKPRSTPPPQRSALP
jgi:hypothetical protein